MSKGSKRRPAATAAKAPPREAHLVIGALLLALLLRFLGIGWGLPSPAEEAYPLKIAWIMSGLSGTSSFTLDPTISGGITRERLLGALQLARSGGTP